LRACKATLQKQRPDAILFDQGLKGCRPESFWYLKVAATPRGALAAPIPAFQTIWAFRPLALAESCVYVFLFGEIKLVQSM
jgi:hypothetical protein